MKTLALALEITQPITRVKYRFGMWGYVRLRGQLRGFIFPAFLPKSDGFPGTFFFFRNTRTVFPKKKVPDWTFPDGPGTIRVESAMPHTVNDMVMRLLMNVAFFQTTRWLSLVSIQWASSHRTDYYMNLDHVQCWYLPSRPVGLGVSHGLTTNRTQHSLFFPRLISSLYTVAV